MFIFGTDRRAGLADGNCCYQAVFTQISTFFDSVRNFSKRTPVQTNQKNSPWYNQPGIGLPDKDPAYVEQAFRWAHEADPRALLFYNENGGEGLNQKSDAIYATVKDFKHRGVLIDGVGLQMHIAEPGFDTNALAVNVTRLTRLGLQVHITELDVALPQDFSGAVRNEDLIRQADVYRRMVRACLQSQGCTAIQAWGFTDKYSRIGSHLGSRAERRFLWIAPTHPNRPMALCWKKYPGMGTASLKPQTLHSIRSLKWGRSNGMHHTSMPLHL
jgi:GH35 family endo-1,4-beta-xylanase